MRKLLIAFCVLPILINPKPAKAQDASVGGRLAVTVTDQTGGVIPSATVTAISTAAAGARPIAPVLTGADGVAVFDKLDPGRYTLRAEFPGFETVEVRDYRLRGGENKRSITLPIRKVAEDVTVARDKQSASLDPRGSAFSTVLTREQIAMLPDDPDEMEAVLKAMAPPGATIRVDGFTGGRLPPKSQIRSIRLPRTDQYAAQNHGGMNGLMFIDIMTQPGNGPLRGSLDVTVRDDALNAKNPFAQAKGIESLRQGGFSLSGTIAPNRSSFSLTAQRASLFDTTPMLVALPGQTRAGLVSQPTERLNFSGRFDQAVRKDHMLRVSFARNGADRSNLGVGAYDLPERAYATSTAESVLRISENGPIGRRFFSESRLQLRQTSSASTSAVEQPTVRVLDAFTAGGAQQAGGRRTLEFEAATDLDYVRGSHSYRAGLLLEGGKYRSDDFTNYLGTFTFASLADYEAGRAMNYTRRVGDASVRYNNFQVGGYAQDDYRVARSLLLSYGVRYEAQTLIHDQNNWSPRGTITWSPFKNGKTTIRGGYGFLSDWLGTSTFEQTLRVDGYRLQELNILNPSYPDPGLSGATPATNRYQLGGNLRLPEVSMFNVGLDQAITPNVRVSASYTSRQGLRVLRGRNLNPIENGARLDPRFSNVIEVTGDASARTQMVTVTGSFISLNWHQTIVSGNYSFASARSNSTGPFGVPASADDLEAEWAVTSPRHRAGASFNMQPVRDLGVSLMLRAQSGTPYTMTTGADTNGDGLFTDRPAGTPRNSLLTTPQWDLGVRVSYAIGFGRRGAASGPGGGQVVMVGAGGGGAMPGAFGGSASDRRFRIEFYVSSQNVTNHRNYIGYSGVVTSPFFGQPTNVLNPRKIELGARFGF